MRFRSPTAFAGRAALPGAAGIRTIPLRCCRSVPPSNPASGPAPSLAPATNSRRGRWRNGSSPLRFSACARRMRPHVPVTSDCRTALTGAGSHRSCTAASLGGRCSAISASRRTTWPGPSSCFHGSRRRSWGSTLRGVAPTRGCRDVSVPRTHLPFPRRPVRLAALCCESDRPVAPHPLVVQGDGPRAPAAAPGLRPTRAIRSGPCATPMWRLRHAHASRDVRPIPPWAFASLRFSLSSALGTASGPCRSWGLQS